MSITCTNCETVLPEAAPICSECGEDPVELWRDCPDCGGTGVVNVARLPWNEIDATCRRCNGDGKIERPGVMAA